MNPKVELSEVSKQYAAGRSPLSLNSVSLEIGEGEALAIMGPSGSGKSTLLNIVGGLDRPTSGRVIVDGQDLSRLNETGLARFRRDRVGIIFQFFNLLNTLTVIDNVLLPAELAGVPGPERRRRAVELLERLGIAKLADHYPARVSGGERQRAAIARALINRPALLLADEPTGALDSQSGESVMAILAELNRAGQTLILVTHEPRLAHAAAARVIRLVDGLIVEGDDRPALAAIGVVR